jgi:peroxiredoxin
MPALISPGEPAPAFELADLNGRRVRLADYRGRPVVLAFLRGFH